MFEILLPFVFLSGVLLPQRICQTVCRPYFHFPRLYKKKRPRNMVKGHLKFAVLTLKVLTHEFEVESVLLKVS